MDSTLSKCELMRARQTLCEHVELDEQGMGGSNKE